MFSLLRIFGRQPFWLAILLSSVLSVSGVNAASENWWIDIANDRVDAVKTELAMGEDPNARNEKGQPAIMQAIQDQAWGVYDLLARHRNLDPDIANAHDETPLMYLAIVGDLDRAQALIQRGAKVNRLGWTALHYAASKGNVKMVNLLLKEGAIVDAPAPDGTTALMMAAYSGDEATVKAVLGAGAEPTTQNLQELDAADWARNREFRSLANRLEDLITRTLAQRHPRRAANAGGRASTVTGAIEASDKTKEKVSPPAAVVLEPDTASGQSTRQSSSSSRYFDHDRIERDENQF